jgi:hypothetical protein
MRATDLRALIDDFTRRLEDVIREGTRQRALAAIGGGNNLGRAAARIRSVASAPAAVQRRRRLQGQYLGHLRALRGSARKRVQQVAQGQGVKAAVDLARRLRSRG